MATVNVPKVRGKMAEKGYTNIDMAKMLNIDRNTFGSYLKNPDKIPYSVLSKMAEILCDSAEEAVSVFFCNKLT